MSTASNRNSIFHNRGYHVIEPLLSRGFHMAILSGIYSSLNDQVISRG